MTDDDRDISRSVAGFYLIYLALVAIVGGTLLAVLMGAARGQHFHPPEHAAIHDEFYRGWRKPDRPSESCCSDRDCYPVEARMVSGQWFAKRREDGKWLPVPPEKIETNRDSPDGRSHLCAFPPGHGDTVLCFIPGAGG